MKQLALLIMVASSIGLANAENTNNLTKEEAIEKLTPKPVVKTRSIRLNTGGNAETAQPEPEPQPAPSISMQINFAFDSSELTDESKQRLHPLGQALTSEQLANYSFRLAGHTDARGTEGYNQKLSEKRALSVGQYLYDTYGVDPNRLQLFGFGEGQLLDGDNPTSAQNRRVEITTIVE